MRRLFSRNFNKNGKLEIIDRKYDMKTWSCIDGCNAECCGIVPIPIQTYNRLKNKIKKQIMETMRLRGHIISMTKDCSCVFLDDNHKCIIYNHRPMICKLYGTTEELPCPYIDINGNRRTEEDIIKIKELIRLQNKTRADKLK